MNDFERFTRIYQGVTKELALPHSKTDEEISGKIHFVRFVRSYPEDASRIEKSGTIAEAEFLTLYTASAAADVSKRVAKSDVVTTTPRKALINVDMLPLITDENRPVIEALLKIAAIKQGRLNAKFRGNVWFEFVSLAGNEERVAIIKSIYDEVSGLSRNVSRSAKPQNPKTGFVITNIDKATDYSPYYVLALEDLLKTDGDVYAWASVLDLAVILTLMLDNPRKEEFYPRIGELYAKLAGSEVTVDELDVILGKDSGESRTLSMKLRIKPTAKHNLNDQKAIYERMRDALIAA